MQAIATSTTSMPPLLSAEQSDGLIDDINASNKPVTNAPAATTIDLGNNQKAKNLDGKLTQVPMTTPLPPGPKLVKPTGSTGVEATFKLLADLDEIKDLNAFDHDLFEAMVKENFLDFFKLTGLAPVAKVDEAGVFSLYSSVETERENPLSEVQVQTMGTYSFDDAGASYSALLTAVFTAMAALKILAEKVQTENIGHYIKLAYTSTKSQAEQIVEQGFMSMVAGAVQAATTVAMVGAGYMVQREGFVKKDDAFKQKMVIADRNITKSQLDPFSDRVREIDLELIDLETTMHKLNQAGEDFGARGYALLTATGITQLARAAMDPTIRAAEAAATLDATDAGNYEKVVQLALQYLQSLLSTIDGQNSLVAETLQSAVQASAAITNNSKVTAI